MLQGIPHFPCEDSKEIEAKRCGKPEEESFKLLKPKYLAALGII